MGSSEDIPMHQHSPVTGTEYLKYFLLFVVSLLNSSDPSINHLKEWELPSPSQLKVKKIIEAQRYKVMAETVNFIFLPVVNKEIPWLQSASEVY
jgi:hypothetical protein